MIWPFIQVQTKVLSTSMLVPTSESLIATSQAVHRVVHYRARFATTTATTTTVTANATTAAPAPSSRLAPSAPIALIVALERRLGVIIMS